MQLMDWKQELSIDFYLTYRKSEKLAPLVREIRKGKEVHSCTSFLVLFNHLYFQIIKVNTINEIILRESGLAVAFEVTDIYIKPDGF